MWVGWSDTRRGVREDPQCVRGALRGECGFLRGMPLVLRVVQFGIVAEENIEHDEFRDGEVCVPMPWPEP